MTPTPTPMDYFGLFENSPNPYLVLDRSLNIAGANKAYLASVKRDLADIVGRWAWDAFPTDPETERQAIASFERVIRNKQPDTMALLRFDVPRPDAEGGGFEKRFWSITHTPILDSDGEVTLVLQHPIDVTELETMRENLRVADAEGAAKLQPAQSGIFERARSVFEQNLGLQDERERLKNLFAQAPSFMALLEGPTHVFRLTNAAYARLVGHRDVLGRPVAEALPDAAAQGYVDLLDEVYRSGRTHTASGASYAVETVSGGPVDQHYVDFVYQPIRDRRGNVTGIFAEGSDVTARVRAEASVTVGEARNRQILDGAIDYAIVATDLNGRVTRWNEGARRVLGWTEAEMLGESAARFFTPEDVAAGQVEREMRSALQTGRGNDERWHQRKSGERFWAVGELTVLRDESENAVGFVKVLQDRTQQRLVGERMRISEERFRTLLGAVETAFAIVEVRFDADDRPVDYRFLEANPAFERQAGVNLRGKWVTEFAPNLERFWFETYGRVAATGEPATFESYANTFDRWFDVRAIRVGDPAERQIAIFFNDVTERKRAEEQRTELAHEMAHRMKNVLAMVQSIATQTFRTAGSIEEARDAVSGRISALARAQDILTQTQWEAAPIAEVVATALMPHRDVGIERFVIEGPKVELTSQQGLGLSLALHELATNAAKYGALSNPDGTVLISWDLVSDGAFRFEWRETGGPLVAPRTRTGFGSRLVERLVAAYFDGSTELTFEPTGVCFFVAGRVMPARATDANDPIETATRHSNRQDHVART